MLSRMSLADAESLRIGMSKSAVSRGYFQGLVQLIRETLMVSPGQNQQNHSHGAYRKPEANQVELRE